MLLKSLVHGLELLLVLHLALVLLLLADPLVMLLHLFLFLFVLQFLILGLTHHVGVWIVHWRYLMR